VIEMPDNERQWMTITSEKAGLNDQHACRLCHCNIMGPKPVTYNISYSVFFVFFIFCSLGLCCHLTSDKMLLFHWKHLIFFEYLTIPHVHRWCLALTFSFLVCYKSIFFLVVFFITKVHLCNVWLEETIFSKIIFILYFLSFGAR